MSAATRASRSIVRFVAATSAGPIKRLVGTVDIKGKGTAHELAGLDPVVLCDAALVRGAGNPPFGLHPHYGLIAVTTVVEGCFNDHDNINPPDGHLNKTGGIYMVSAGRGVCHAEASATDGQHIAVQTIFKIPNNKKDLLPELIKVDAADIPDLAVTGGTAKLLVGRLGNVESPAKVQALPRVVMVLLTVDAGSTMAVPLDADLEHGFVYVLNGKCKLGGGAEWCEAEKGMWLFGGGNELTVEGGEEGVKVLMLAGKPLGEDWVKLLGRNGFIIAGTEEEAEKVMEVIHKTGDEFSYKKLN